MKLVVEVWLVTKRAGQDYVAHFTSFDDIPDEYIDDDRTYCILSYDYEVELTPIC